MKEFKKSKEFKKLKFYLPMLALTGSLALMRPMIVQAEEEGEEEVLYEEESEEYTQEKIDESTAENTVTSVGTTVVQVSIQEATATNNDNLVINADNNYYFDNTNYYPATDTSSNPGTYIPESVDDEVDRKLSNPDNPDNPSNPDNPNNPNNPSNPSNPENPGQPEVPDVPIPKMGMTLNEYNKITLSVASIGLILIALKSLLKKLGYKISNNSELKVIEKRESKHSKKDKKNKKKELTK